MNKEIAIQSAQLRQLISISRVSLFVSLSLALILAYMQREVIAPAVLAAWLAGVVLTLLLRAAVIVAHRHTTAAGDDSIRALLFKFRLATLAAGLAWGSAGFLLFATGHPQHQMFLIFALAGMTAGSVASFSADLPSAVLYTLPLIAPITARLFAEANSLSVAMGMATSLYLVFMVLSMRRIHRSVRENIALRIEADEREEKIRASEERYRLLLSHLPVGIFHYDGNLVLTYCNDALARILNTTGGRLLGLDMKTLKEKSIQSALRKALSGEMGFYEGHYHAIYSDAERWLSINCAPFRDEQEKIEGGIAIVQDITARKAAEETIKNLAFYDPLTNLPNRRLLLDRLQQSMAASARSGRQVALLFIDLDNFKTLNDTLGHDIGDLLLQQVAQRLTSCVRDGDSVARLGGDEFVVMLEDLSEQAIEAAEQTEAVGEKLLAALGQPYELGLHECRSTPSIGATLFSGHWQGREELLKQADIAMYQAKRAGRNTLRFFDQEMQNAVTARVVLEGELHRALEQRQFCLHYQIQVDSDWRPLGAEALIRWHHPAHGMVLPDQFIRVAEETDLIQPIGNWVLETTCARLKAWQQQAHTRNLVLSINVSAKQFRRPDFVTQVQSAVQRHGIDPGLLKLELTESMLLENIEDMIATMSALKQTGVQFSLDDFGTGYSSLQYLKRLPLDQIKIDRSFVRDIAIDSNDREVVSTIILMVKNLYLDVIAEGVETELQRQFLLRNGCTRYQGYLFGKPMPIDEFEELLLNSLDAQEMPM